ncbi:DUF3667 domain-containing protein [Pedobacter nototheniae]|uniref:DUF3667 domain-containing protein n=1 Tax=Pedobacter nototheniae TaxID=2488994 RepID=UPI0029309605|nr:DUF3667 domain-containing protein [Pedobacter nototheniae]
MVACINCKQSLTENYCSNCGHPAKLKRIDAHYIQHEIEHVLHFEKGIFYTVKELLIRPGDSVKEFISNNRNRLVKPIIYIIVTSLIYSIISHLFHTEDGYINLTQEGNPTVNKISAWVQAHYGYANIIMGVFIAMWAKLFFRKYNYNFFEILILLCFIMGTSMLIYAVFAVIEGLTKFSLMQIGAALGFIYCTWSIGQFFDRKKIASYFKGFAAYILGMITFGLGIAFIAIVYDVILKHA